MSDPYREMIDRRMAEAYAASKKPVRVKGYKQDGDRFIAVREAPSHDDAASRGGGQGAYGKGRRDSLPSRSLAFGCRQARAIRYE